MLISIALLSLCTTLVSAAYSIVDDYTSQSFADQFNFFTGNDPTNGYVNYVDYNTAQSEGLYSVSSNKVYIGVDHQKTISSGRGRDSVRIESKKSYQHGLIVLDLDHMPGSVCGTWPAFWLLSTSATWPHGGEVDIIEGVNTQGSNSFAVHTNAGCSISNTGGMSSEIKSPNCDVNAPDQPNNQGCSISATNTNSYGDGFNQVGGGVYATEWTSDGISIWFFPRSAIPADLASGTPDPTGWGLPTARFAGQCDWDEKVVNQQIIFDITFCGDWSGNAFSTDAVCSSKGASCQAFVQNNPSAFEDSYWSINSLKVYQENGRDPVSTGVTPPSPPVSPSVIPPTPPVSPANPMPSTLATVLQTPSSPSYTGPAAPVSNNQAPPPANTYTQAYDPAAITPAGPSASYTQAYIPAANNISPYTASWNSWSAQQTGWNNPGNPGSWNGGQQPNGNSGAWNGGQQPNGNAGVWNADQQQNANPGSWNAGQQQNRNSGNRWNRFS